MESRRILSKSIILPYYIGRRIFRIDKGNQKLIDQLVKKYDFQSSKVDEITNAQQSETKHDVTMSSENIFIELFELMPIIDSQIENRQKYL